MELRRLGRSELRVPPLSFGGYAIGGWYWGRNDDGAALDAIRASIDGGMTALDTAPIYGFGHSERLIGQAIRGRREEVTVMTKVGLRWDHPEAPVFFETEAAGKRMGVQRTSEPASVRHEVEQSLGRLGIECIDLVQVHAPDPDTPIADTMGALAELRDEGKLRAIGVSNYSVEQLDEASEALAPHPLASDQPHYSLLSRDIEKDVLPWAREHGVGLLTYSPLEQGLLTGKVDASRTFEASDGRSRRTAFSRANRLRVLAVLERAVAPIARAHDVTLAQVVLAWTAAQPGITSILVGARTAEQAAENSVAAGLVLAPEELRCLDRAFQSRILREPLARRVRSAGGRVLRRLGLR